VAVAAEVFRERVHRDFLIVLRIERLPASVVVAFLGRLGSAVVAPRALGRRRAGEIVRDRDRTRLRRRAKLLLLTRVAAVGRRDRRSAMLALLEIGREERSVGGGLRSWLDALFFHRPRARPLFLIVREPGRGVRREQAQLQELVSLRQPLANEDETTTQRKL